MNVNVKELGEKFKAFFVGMSKKTRTLLVVVLAAIVIVAVAIALFLNTRPYTVLFTGLSNDEMGSIVTYLKDNGVTDYRINNDSILVPSGQESQLQADLLIAGYPKSGLAYETYQSMSGTLATESDRKIAYIYDLQDRMAATIRCFDGVKSAVVNITEGEDRRYVLDSTNYTEAKASVLITLSGSQKLSNQTAAAIRTLVANGVSSLNIDNVFIGDNLGNSYGNTDGTADFNEASALKLRIEEQVNNEIRTQVMQVLVPLYGEDNVRVGVNSVVDVSRSVTETVNYTEPEWAADGSTRGRGILDTRNYDWEVIRDDVNTVGGTVGTTTNSDINNYVEEGAALYGDEAYIRSAGSDEYAIDTKTEQTERVAPVVTDLMVSVSINSATAGAVNTQSLMDHIARASGINADYQADKISILVAPFYNPTTDGTTTDPVQTLAPWMIYAAIAGAVLLLILLILITILRRRSKRKKAKELGKLLNSALDNAPEPEPIGADIMNVKTERSMELRQEIRQFADQNPEIAAQMLKSWLKGGEEVG